jgi:hypothetical protein
MRTILKFTGIVIAMASLMADPALAIKPGKTTNPNGFINGPHYNLNIIGKKEGFQCPEQQYDEITGEPIYGNVIFIPKSGNDIKIVMKSGSNKGKAKQTITDFAVTDPCTFDDGRAELYLPPAPKYKVFARALAMLPGDHYIEIDPGLEMVVDEAGNILYYMGTLTKDGWEKGDAIYRMKGKHPAVDITKMFEYSGLICYLTDDSVNRYCFDEISSYVCQPEDLCCFDTTGPDGVPDGVFDGCDLMVDVMVDGACPEGTTYFDADCRLYIDEWVFGIAEFVTYFWDVTNYDLKLLQVRFYPVEE